MSGFWKQFKKSKVHKTDALASQQHKVTWLHALFSIVPEVIKSNNARLQFSKAKLEEENISNNLALIRQQTSRMKLENKKLEMDIRKLKFQLIAQRMEEQHEIQLEKMFNQRKHEDDIHQLHMTTLIAISIIVAIVAVLSVISKSLFLD